MQKTRMDRGFVVNNVYNAILRVEKCLENCLAIENTYDHNRCLCSIVTIAACKAL